MSAEVRASVAAVGGAEAAATAAAPAPAVARAPEAAVTAIVRPRRDGGSAAAPRAAQDRDEGNADPGRDQQIGRNDQQNGRNGGRARRRSSAAGAGHGRHRGGARPTRQPRRGNGPGGEKPTRARRAAAWVREGVQSSRAARKCDDRIPRGGGPRRPQRPAQASPRARCCRDTVKQAARGGAWPPLLGARSRPPPVPWSSGGGPAVRSQRASGE